MSTLDAFKKASTNLNTMVNDANTKKDYNEGFWKLKLEDGKNLASAVIRFLPQPDPNKLPYQKSGNHFFKGDDGRWCIAQCPRITFNEKCPICEHNSKLWNADPEFQKDVYPLRKARQTYLMNILVIDDKQNPDNNGKVFLFDCTPGMFKMILDAMSGEFGDEPLQPFNIFEGNNFNIRLRKDMAKKMNSYDKSSFDTNKTPIAGNDKEIEAIIKQLYDLEKFLRDKTISTEELQSKADNAFATYFDGVAPSAPAPKSTKQKLTNDEIFGNDDLPDSFKTPVSSGSEDSSEEEDEDDILARFQKKIAEENN